MASNPPRIFSPSRRIAARARMLALQSAADAPRYLIADMVEDVLERLAFLRVSPRRALVIGDFTNELASSLASAEVVTAEPVHGFAEESPISGGDYDLIASLGTLDTINDLPGALIHLRNALAQGGLLIASFPGAGSLPALRTAMLAADGDRPAPRLHPQIDVRAGGQLLQRAGLANPVVDSRSLDVGFRSLDRLVGDLRAQGLGNVLANAGPPLTRAMRMIAEAAFADAACEGRTVEHFEILTLSGWRA